MIPIDVQCENFSAIENMMFIGYPSAYMIKNMISII